MRGSPHGVIDADFGGGAVVAELGSGSAAHSVVVQASGKIVIAGTAYAIAEGRSDFKPTLARYLSNGDLDAAFGNDGTVSTSQATFQMANAMVVGPRRAYRHR